MPTTEPQAASAVAHLLPSSQFGGAEQVAVGLIRRARERGEAPRVIALRGNAAEAGLTAALGPCVEGPLARSPGKLDRMDALRLSGFALRQGRPGQVVHAHLPWPDRLGTALLARGTAPMVVTFHLLPTHPLAGLGDVAVSPLRGSIAANVARRVAPLRFVALTDGDRQRLQREFPGVQVERVYNAPTQPYGPVPAPLPFTSGVRILCVGALSSRKGHDRVLRALAALDGNTSFSLCIAGAGDQHHALEQLARDLGIAERVRLVGHVAAPHLYQQADLFISGSRAEGMPLVLLEAMAAGVPVLASAIPAHREVLVSLPSALLDEQEQSWSRDIQRFLQNAQLRRTLGEAGRRLVSDRFSSSQQDAAYGRLYAELARA